MTMAEGAITPVINELATYIAGAATQALPDAVQEKTRVCFMWPSVN